MSNTIFNGRGFAAKVEMEVRDRVREMAKKLGRLPKLVTIVNPANEAGIKYTQLKAKMAARLGVEFQEFKIQNAKLKTTTQNLKVLLKKLNTDKTVDGIMIQIPFPSGNELIPLIDPSKDVDGLREDSPFKPAVVRAVMEILGHSLKGLTSQRVAVVGAKGFVGRRLMRVLLNAIGMDKNDFDPSTLLRADVIISATGQAGVITDSMVKDGFVAIDVGYPQAEFTSAALAKASFYTPVPGGVGPVTVAMLFANLLKYRL